MTLCASPVSRQPSAVSHYPNPLAPRPAPLLSFPQSPQLQQEGFAMSDSRDPRGGNWTRRRFLETVGAAGGATALYETMVAMGLIRVPEAFAGPPDLPPDHGKDKHVVILGAGFAGLTAPSELHKARYPVTVPQATP